MNSQADTKSSKAPREMNLRAALSVLGATLSLFCTVGFLNAFGVFQKYYRSNMLSNKSESEISWIGSVTIFLLYALAPVSGVLVDKLGPKWLLPIGSLGLLVGVFMTSLCTQYYQFFLAQAVLLGTSLALLTWPPIAVVSRSLPTHRGLALGIVFSGSSIGGVVWPIMLARLLERSNLTFGWVLRIVGFTMLPLLAIACVTVREPHHHLQSTSQASSTTVRTTVTNDDAPSSQPTAAKEPKESKPDLSNPPIPIPNSVPTPTSTKQQTQTQTLKRSDVTTLLKSPIFISLAAGLAIFNLGLFIPLFFVSSYATNALGIPAQTAFYLISAINGTSLLGRVIPGFLADRYLGHYNVCVVAAVSSAVVAFCWTLAKDLAGLIVLSLVYGFTSGTLLALQNICVAKIAGLHMQGTAMGLLIGCEAVTTLVGLPIGSAILSRYGYLAMSMFTGAALLSGSLLIIISRLILNRKIFFAV